MKTNTSRRWGRLICLSAFGLISLSIGLPSLVEAQFYGGRSWQPPAVGTPAVGNDGIRAQWQGYYTNNPAWFKEGRVSPNGGQGTYPNTYQFPTGGGWSR